MRGDDESSQLCEREDVDLITRDYTSSDGVVHTNTHPHTRGILTLAELNNAHTHGVQNGPA